jgi:ribosome-binding factor A
LQTRLRDPEIGFVTVTDVQVSGDLRHAEVLVSVLGTEAEREQTMNALRRAQAFVRAEVAQVLDLRYAPEIVFLYDHSIERGARIFELLAEIRETQKQDESEKDEGKSG